MSATTGVLALIGLPTIAIVAAAGSAFFLWRGGRLAAGRMVEKVIENRQCTPEFVLPKLRSYPRSAPIHLALSQMAAVTDGLDSAAAWDSINTHLQMFPKHDAGHLLCARIAAARGDTTRERDELKAGLRGTGDSDTQRALHFEYGMAATRAADWDEAIARFVRMQRRFPDKPEAFLEEVRAWDRKGDVATARRRLQDMLRLFPGDPIALRTIARMAEKAADWPASASYWAQYRTVSDRDVAGYLGGASAAWKLADLAERDRLLEQAEFIFASDKDALGEIARGRQLPPG